MKALVSAILQLALLLAGRAARATLAELGAVEPVTAPAMRLQLAPAGGPDLGTSAQSGSSPLASGFIPLPLRIAGEVAVTRPFLEVVAPSGIFQGPAQDETVAATQPLIMPQESGLSSVLLWGLPSGLATRLSCASTETGFPYIAPRSWIAASGTGWSLAFSYYSLTFHEEQLFNLSARRKFDFLSPSLLQEEPDMGAPNVDDQ